MVYLLYGVMSGDVYLHNFLVTAQIVMSHLYEFQSA
jgi:hypothetical protein